MEAAVGTLPHPGGCPTLWKRQPGDGRLLLGKASSPVKWGKEKTNLIILLFYPPGAKGGRERSDSGAHSLTHPPGPPMVGHPLTLQQLPRPPLPSPCRPRGRGLAPAPHPRVLAPSAASGESQQSGPIEYNAKTGQGVLGPRVLGTINCLPVLWQREYLSVAMSLSEEGSAPCDSLIYLTLLTFLKGQRSGCLFLCSKQDPGILSSAQVQMFPVAV